MRTFELSCAPKALLNLYDHLTCIVSLACVVSCTLQGSLFKQQGLGHACKPDKDGASRCDIILLRLYPVVYSSTCCYAHQVAPKKGEPAGLINCGLTDFPCTRQPRTIHVSCHRVSQGKVDVVVGQSPACYWFPAQWAAFLTAQHAQALHASAPCRLHSSVMAILHSSVPVCNGLQAC